MAGACGAAMAHKGGCPMCTHGAHSVSTVAPAKIAPRGM